MNEFFAGTEYGGSPFQLFGIAHITALGIILLVNLSLLYLRAHPNQQVFKGIRYSLAILLLVNETAYHLWRWTTGQWTIQIMLPFHLCTLMVYFSAVTLLTKSRLLYQYLYFLGLGAALQALLTPNAEIWGFPHFRFFQTFIAHGGIVIAAVYMTIVERYRPHWKTILRIAVVLNIYMVLVQIVNFLIGSNYLWIARKPDFSSLIDMLGPWPWYILPMELIGLLVFILLYLPFAIMDWRMKSSN